MLNVCEAGQKKSASSAVNRIRGSRTPALNLGTDRKRQRVNCGKRREPRMENQQPKSTMIPNSAVSDKPLIDFVVELMENTKNRFPTSMPDATWDAWLEDWQGLVKEFGRKKFDIAVRRC